MARWINVKKPFDYRWPDRSALTAFAEHPHYPFPRDEFVKDEVADFAVARGYASAGKGHAASRSRKGKRSGKKDTTTAKAADMGTGLRVGEPDVPDDDRAADRAAVDHDAG